MANRSTTQVTRVAIAGAFLVGILGLIVLLRRAENTAIMPSKLSEWSDSEKRDSLSTPTSLTLDETPLDKNLDRKPVQRIIAGFVMTEDGQAVAGADVSWTTIADHDSSMYYNWALIDIDDLEFRTLRTRTDSQGFFSFPNEPPAADARESVLWITAAGFQPSYHHFYAAGEHTVPSPIILRRDSPASVRVVDSTGSPVTAAQIHHLGWQPSANSTPADAGLDAYHVFHREKRSGVSGLALFPLLPGTQVLWAEMNGEESERWTGSPISEIVLKLQPCFFLSGAVVPENDPELRLDDLYIVCGVARGALHSVLKQAPVSSLGSFGPLPIPLLDGGTYDFTLGGGGVLHEQHTISPPLPGAQVVVDFTAKQGVALRVRVVDAQGRPIAGSAVWAWSLGKEESSALRARTDIDGNATLAGFPAKTVSVQATAKGYAASPNRLLDLSSPDNQSTVFTLDQAGTLMGRCTHDGQPVEDFSIVFWQGDTGINRIQKIFRQSKDGSFVIDEVPLGEILLYASSDKFPRSDIKAALITSDGTAEIEIDLPDAIVGYGQVIDNQTGDPVAQAEIQLYSNYRANYHEPWGSRTKVDHQGHFRIRGFAPGDTRFTVSAPSYARWLGHTVGVVGEEIDLGLIALARNQNLEVRLVNTGPTPVNFSEYRVIPLGNQFYPMKDVSELGRATFEGGPGNYYIRLLCPDGSEKSIETYLYSGGNWIVEFPVGGGKRLDVQAEAPSGESLSDFGAANAQVTFNSRQGQAVQYYKVLSPEGRAIFDGITAERIVVEIFDSRWSLLGAALTILDSGTQSLSVPIGGHGFRLRVVDDQGQPLEGTTVRLVTPFEADVGWLLQVVTDSAGEVIFRSLGLDRVFVNLSHPMHGSRAGIPVDLSQLSAEEVVTLPLDAQCKLRLRLVDGSSPLPAVPIRLYSGECKFEIGVFTSDSAGRVEAESISSGLYRVVIQHPGLWPFDRILQVSGHSSEQSIEVRRLCGLAVETRTSGGVPIAGVPVDLIYTESGESVSQWVAQGRINLPSNGVLTNGSGRALIEGIPNGLYSWSASIGKEVLAGQIAIPAKSIGNLIIVKEY
jgi:hypothetical protein